MNELQEFFEEVAASAVATPNRSNVRNLGQVMPGFSRRLREQGLDDMPSPVVGVILSLLVAEVVDSFNADERVIFLQGVEAVRAPISEEEILGAMSPTEPRSAKEIGDIIMAKRLGKKS